MNVRAVAIVSLAVAASVVSFAVAAGGPTRGVTEDCSTQSRGGFANPFSNPANLVIGPLVLVGAGGDDAGFSPEAGGNKFPLIVRPGHRVRIALPRSARPGAGLAYGPLPTGEVAVADAHRVVNFIACRRLSPGSADGRRRGFWPGGVLAESPRCVPLRVWVDDRRSPRRVVLRMGVDSCQ